MPRRPKKSAGERLVTQLVGVGQWIVGSSAKKKKEVFFTKSNSRLYLMRGFRSTPNFRLCNPRQFLWVERSSRSCSRSCCTRCGVEAFWPITTEGKRRLIPKLVGFRLLMKRLKWKTNSLTVRLEISEVSVACQETFSLVAI